MGAEHTSVPIIFFAKALISFTARGARFLKPMPCSSFRRWTVYSRVTTSVAAVAFFLSPFALHVDGSEGSARERDGARNRRQDRVGSLASHRATTQGTLWQGLTWRCDVDAAWVFPQSSARQSMNIVRCATRAHYVKTHSHKSVT